MLFISSGDVSVNEGDEMFDVCVMLDRPINNSVAFSLNFADGTAMGM